MTPCLTPACQWAAARLSTSTDPFTQPCDYFLFKCGSHGFSPEIGGRQRGQGIPGHPQNQMEKSVWPERQDEMNEHRRLREDKILSRKAVLLQYLREILGRRLSITFFFLKKQKLSFERVSEYTLSVFRLRCNNWVHVKAKTKLSRELHKRTWGKIPKWNIK